MDIFFIILNRNFDQYKTFMQIIAIKFGEIGLIKGSGTGKEKNEIEIYTVMH